MRIIGRPSADYAEQTENSPVYHYKDISRPVFLAHGTEDIVVDVEHSWRLRKLLQLIDRDPEFIIIDDIGHGYGNVGQAEQLYVPLVEFLDTN